MKKSADLARGRTAGRQWRQARANLLLALCLSFTAAFPASAEEQVRIGLGFGLAFLPAYICEDLKLVEKHGKESHIELRASYQRFLGAGALQEALASGGIDMAPFGTAPLLAAWEKARDTPRQIFAVSGLTTLPPVLLTNRNDVRSLADFRSADRIAIPSRSAPQLYLLQMQSEKVFGQYDKLRAQIVVLSHADAVNDLLGAKDSVTGYFSSAPYAEIALADGHVHKVLSGSDVIDGKASFLILGASRGYIAANPKVPEAVAKAIDEAARIIHDDPRRAAEIYLVHEPSRVLDAGALAGILAGLKDEFGSAVRGIGAFADFMGRHGELKSPPQSWKEIVAPALLNSPGS
jgi:ABC-type nitrate/sulfonate/bicarbonate transport system substrate-binding protein